MNYRLLSPRRRERLCAMVDRIGVTRTANLYNVTAGCISVWYKRIKGHTVRDFSKSNAAYIAFLLQHPIKGVEVMFI